jgi:7-keto-8-aminopelargonate synthetase-like enzyme
MLIQSQEIVSYLRHCSYASVYAASMSPPCAQQALCALRVISGEDGGDDGTHIYLGLFLDSQLDKQEKREFRN